MANQTWRRLDNAAQIFPSGTTDRRTHIFRLAVTLREAVVPPLYAESASPCLVFRPPI